MLYIQTWSIFWDIYSTSQLQGMVHVRNRTCMCVRVGVRGGRDMVRPFARMLQRQKRKSQVQNKSFPVPCWRAAGWSCYTLRVSTSIFSSAWEASASWWLTLGRTVTTGPPPWMAWRKFQVSSEIWPESAPVETEEEMENVKPRKLNDMLVHKKCSAAKTSLYTKIRPYSKRLCVWVNSLILHFPPKCLHNEMVIMWQETIRVSLVW